MLNEPTILVVCSGNICRSPMTEGLLKKRLGTETVNVISAGTMGITGYPASENGIEVCRLHDIDISSHRSAGVNGELVEKSGGNIYALPQDEKKKWAAALRPVRDAWVKRVAAKGIDGEKFLARMAELTKQYQ